MSLVTTICTATGCTGAPPTKPGTASVSASSTINVGCTTTDRIGWPSPSCADFLSEDDYLDAHREQLVREMVG